MRMEAANALPETPSALIRLALDDLRKVERDPRYEVWMGYWHTGTGHPERTRCCVCLAGAVMAGTLGAQPSDALCPGSYDEGTRGRLEALDYFRKGHAGGALMRFYPDRDYEEMIAMGETLGGIVVSRYVQGQDNSAWYVQMDMLAQALEERGH